MTGLGTVGQAVAVFVATNVDDVVILALFFGRAAGHRAATTAVVVGQYLGFVAILAGSVVAALGARLLPESSIAYLGLLPLLLGIYAAWEAWRSRGDDDDDAAGPSQLGVLTVAAVTFANGGDNIGVYIPVFAVAGVAGMVTYVVVFLVGVAACCALGWYLATRPAIARLMARWGDVVLPVVLIVLGVVILVEGGAFGI
ncbi:cadmium resistance transporter [Mycolicibacterium lacusdiani]|uniref:cadmium resistance transporter n=1 Tax=Mycolicibacterium lacusdiani TaxID=2895283 RepID=UPI001F1A9DDD|nr:cadmium resistance transporter [Mycolicibacterium lacusdiani]